MATSRTPLFPSVSAVVLAAGLSRRAAPHHKLLLPVSTGHGRTVVAATVSVICEVGFGEVIVVTGHARERVEAALDGLPVRFVFAEDFASGMGHSLAAGIRATSPQARAFGVVPGDLPEISSSLVCRIVEAFQADDERRHVVPVVGDARGHPVILDAGLRSALTSLQGDVGARQLLRQESERGRCRMLEVGDRAILRDVDVGPT